jgi:hypothetical protein
MFGAAGIALAQEPERAPRPAPAPTFEPPPSEPTRDVAVPRKAEPRAEAPRREAPRAESPRVTSGEEGNRRRERSSDAPPAPAASPNVSSSESQGAERRGAVRRPPADSGRATTPRDRAVVRTGRPPRDYDGDHDHYRVYYYPSYYSYGRYYDPFYYSGFHLGYLAYSPWGWMPAFYGYPYGYGAYGYSGPGYDIGRLRIKVQPRDAEVYVDGYFAGNVDDFDGTFQSLKLETGGYRIEIRKPGFETLQFDVHVQPDRTITYRGQLRAAP